ncbi:MAG TPA: hypothetical protein VNA17_08295 [Pyrinomonadaceae bacterium]|nr:hypothetical protein [Pyrinomonadaceae bacterium]
MTKPKTQNSAVVLATLGVYLGLLMAGAVPQVMASAALTRQFDVRDEIESSDEFDNKPDDKRTPVSTSVQIYLEDVEQFLTSLGRLAARGSFDAKKDTFNLLQATVLPCVDTSRAGRFTPVKFESTSEAVRSPLATFSREMVYGYSLGDCLVNNAFPDVEAVDSRFDLKLDGQGLTARLEVKKGSEQEARKLLESLNAALRIYAAAESTRLRKRVIDHTRFSVRNSLVIVRLHLARADLDSLLASNAK